LPSIVPDRGLNFKPEANSLSMFFKKHITVFIYLVLITFCGGSASLWAAAPSANGEIRRFLDAADSARYQQHLADAEMLFQKVLAKVSGERPEAGDAHFGLAAVYYDQGRYEKSRQQYRHALDVYERVYGPGHVCTARSLNGLASACLSLGEYSAALVYYTHSLVLYKELYGEKDAVIAGCLVNVAEVYTLLGNPVKAEALLVQSLETAMAISGESHSQLVTILNNLAKVAANQGEYARAEHFYERALALLEKTKNPDNRLKAAVLNNLAGICFSQGDDDRAKQLYERALEIDQKVLARGHPAVGIRLNNLAEIYGKAGNDARALDLYAQALGIARERNFLELAWRVQFNLACLLDGQEKETAAVYFAKKAVNTLQAMRLGIRDIDRKLQRSFLKDKFHVYRFLADLLIDAGRLQEAQQVLDLQKEEEYFDFIRRNAAKDSRLSLTPEEERLEVRYQEINRKIAALGREMAGLEQKQARGLSADERVRYRRLAADLAVARKAFTKSFSEILKELGDVAIERYADIREKRIEKPGKLQQAIRGFGHGAVAVHYLICENKLRMILTTGEIQLVRDAGISEKALNRKIMNYRKVLQRPRLSPFPLAEELYDIVIRPIEKDLAQARAKTLMLCLDGALRYLPVGALYDGRRYLTEKYSIAVYTAAAGLSVEKAGSSPWKVAGFGLSRGINGLDPLKGVEAELEGIIVRGENDPDGVVPGVIYLNENFTYRRIGSALAQNYPVLHLASHFELNPGRAENSYLVLGDGTELSLARIREDRHDFSGVEMISLSACNTAVGTPGANGSEIESFGALVQNKGAKSVLATLWPVSDKSTGGFMKNLYRLHEAGEGLSKSAALRAAQLCFIYGGEKAGSGTRKTGLKADMHSKLVFTPDRKAPYAHPYYWAPFVLMGNWM